MINTLEITQYTPRHNNTLRGFATILIPGLGMEIPGFSIHEKNSHRWVELPSKPPANPGEKWPKTIFFDSKKEEERFKNGILKALDEYQSEDETSDGYTPDFQFQIPNDDGIHV